MADTRPRSAQPLRYLLLIVGFVLAAVPLATGSISPAAAQGQVSTLATPPNVIVIITDDQSMGLMDAMPQTTALLADQGLTLTDGFIPTSICCPSRSSLLSGDYSHTTGVYTNGIGDSLGGWPVFNQSSESQTLATALHAAGYNTGFFGKYMNRWVRDHPAGYTPPGWDTFVFFDPDEGGDGDYYNYLLDGTIEPIHYSNAPEDYSTDVIAEYASQYITNAPTDAPFFLYFSPFGVHSPFVPAPRHMDTWPLEPRSAIPALNEADVSDKPPWVQAKPLVNGMEQRVNFTRQHEVAMSVDDAVSRLFDALGQRVDNTLIVYLSDNGVMLGSHRITGKLVPYRMATEVPMFLRWDGVIPPGTESDRATPNVDLTATIARATGTSWPMEGRSVLSRDRNGTLVESVEINDHPAYCGWRTKDYLYVEYADRSREFYDYTRDPNELRNAVDRARNAEIVTRLRAAAKAACLPMPPGFSWG